MPMWTVTTRATVERVYEVEAADAKAARDASVNSSPVSETDLDEETIEILSVGAAKPDPFAVLEKIRVRV